MRENPPKSVVSERPNGARRNRGSMEINRQRAAAIARRVEEWFPGAARRLPWRTSPRSLYSALVVESMSQQTQIARVAERFIRFIARFPTVASLAAADEREVLALWSGLGYYSRARNLHLAARAIVERHGGRVPGDVEPLLQLPGVGPYSAGAIASIAGGQRTPTVDGNVLRVLLRIQGRDLHPETPQTRQWSWAAAEALVRASTDPGVFNEGLMELGATICTPRSPDCGSCPLSKLCAARRLGLTEVIPRPKRSTPPAQRRAIYCASVVVRDRRGRVLVQQRPAQGLWAGLWQAPTVESPDGPPTRAAAAQAGGVRAADLDRTPREAFAHLTSHRVIRFEVWVSRRRRPAQIRPGQLWVFPADLSGLGLSTPQRRILSIGLSRDD